MITNYGWTGVFKGMASAQPNTTSNIDNNIREGQGFEPSIIFGVVASIRDNISGLIEFIPLKSQGKVERARPVSPDLKSIPIPGEVVIVINNPVSNIISNDNPSSAAGEDFLYLNGINLWNNPSFNGITDNQIISNPDTLNYFNPETVANVQPLISAPGDNILEGRFGNTIRLGNTNSNFGNEWSENGKKGDPITIISNGQAPENASNVENISEDLSSIYLTSYQKIANFSLVKQTFSSYDRGHEPETPKEFISPQIILNSDRVTLNAKTDSVLISGDKSVFLSSNKSINTTSKEFYIDSIDIRLGSPNASEPVLLGNETVKQLIKLTNQVKNLGKIAETLKLFPGGIPVPDAGSNLIGTSITTTCDSILNKLKDNQRGIKSNFVKTK
tara:strand:+ start:127 stop:1290 length:1164 start_codon:yes stop_codon:yes gene_type:complete